MTLLRNLLLSIALASVLQAQGTLEIIAAYYGTGDYFSDVTNRLKGMAQTNGVSAPVDARTLGIDPRPGTAKVLRIYYRLDGQFAQGEWRDGETAQVGAARAGRFGTMRRGQAAANSLRIVRASYGEGNRMRDVTGVLQSRMTGDRLEMQVTNDNLGGDPAPAVAKQLLLTYEYQGRSYDVRVAENEWVRLPEGSNAAPGQTAQGGSLFSFSSLRIVSAQYGQGNRMRDVTAMVTNRVANDKVSFTVENGALGGDPAIGADKQIYVVYEVNGQRREKRVDEGKRLDLP